MPEALPTRVLSDRPDLKEYKARRQRLLKQLSEPAYINTDAACRGEIAGIAYASKALGSRSETIKCGNIARAECLALLMAMEDAHKVLGGPVEFRVDSTAAVGYRAARVKEVRDLRRIIDLLLENHTSWRITWVSGGDNHEANDLARAALDKWEES
jgi:ribonuclease HI